MLFSIRQKLTYMELQASINPPIVWILTFIENGQEINTIDDHYNNCSTIHNHLSPTFKIVITYSNLALMLANDIHSTEIDKLQSIEPRIVYWKRLRFHSIITPVVTNRNYDRSHVYRHPSPFHTEDARENANWQWNTTRMNDFGKGEEADDRGMWGGGGTEEVRARVLVSHLFSSPAEAFDVLA